MSDILDIYPESDGLPIAESDLTRDCLFNCLQILSNYFQDYQDIYVSAALFIYYTEGNRSERIAPDIFVVKGVEKKKRMNYRVWEERGKIPNFVLEITSLATRVIDEIDKFNLYQKLGVAEYFLYDPGKDYLQPLLKKFRLVDGNYQLVEPVVLPKGGLYYSSTELDLKLMLIDNQLHFYKSC